MAEAAPKRLIPLLRGLPNYGVGELVECVRHSPNVRYLVANVRPGSDGKHGDVYAFRLWNVRRGFKRVTPVHGPELSLGRLPWSKVGSLEKFDEAVSKRDKGFVEVWEMRKKLQVKVGSIKNEPLWRVALAGKQPWVFQTDWNKELEKLAGGTTAEAGSEPGAQPQAQARA